MCMRYYAANDGQYLFNIQLRWMGRVLALFFRCLVFSPLVLTGYWITSRLLDQHTSGLWCILSIAVQSCLLYSFVYFLKGILVGLKKTGSWLWVFVWLPLVLYTCILPVWFVYHPIVQYVHDPELAWFISILFGCYIYTRYRFHSNITPRVVYPMYQAGINAVVSLLNSPFKLQGARSVSII